MVWRHVADHKGRSAPEGPDSHFPRLDEVVRDVLNAGARGFLLKSDAARDLLVAVEALRRDKTYFTSKVAAMGLEGYLKGGTKAAAISLGRDRLTRGSVKSSSCSPKARAPRKSRWRWD